MVWIADDGAVYTHNPDVDPDTCDHEWEPYSSELIVVSDEEFYAQPLRMDWAPPRYVDCKKCGAPIDRGRYEKAISIPALAEDWPFLDD